MGSAASSNGNGSWSCSNVINPELFRITVFSRAYIGLLKERLESYELPTTKTMKIPTERVPLEKVELEFSGLYAPVHDEDWPDPGPMKEFIQAAITKGTAFYDNNKSHWQPDENPEEYIEEHFGSMWPRQLTKWEDKTSDAAFEQLCFFGLGSHRLEVIEGASDDPMSEFYVIKLDFMKNLETRGRFDRYGADAYFSKDKKVLKIDRGGQTFFPHQGTKWEAAKMAFRGSLVALVTLWDHLIFVHAAAANYVTTCTRECLGPDHPLRRLLKPFQFRTVAINYLASMALFPEKGLVHRGFAFSLQGLKDGVRLGVENVRTVSFPERAAAKGMQDSDVPFFQDGLEYWHIVHKFVSKTLVLYFSDEALIADPEIQEFWKAMNNSAPNHDLPQLSATTLKAFLTDFIFTVTGFHNHVGTLGEYLHDPLFLPIAWIKGRNASHPPNSVIGSIIICLTGFQMPRLMENFDHLLLDENAVRIAAEFRSDLEEQQKVVVARNATRPHPYEGFNPEHMEMSVAI